MSIESLKSIQQAVQRELNSLSLGAQPPVNSPSRVKRTDAFLGGVAASLANVPEGEVVKHLEGFLEKLISLKTTEASDQKGKANLKQAVEKLESKYSNLDSIARIIEPKGETVALAVVGDQSDELLLEILEDLKNHQVKVRSLGRISAEEASEENPFPHGRSIDNKRLLEFLPDLEVLRIGPDSDIDIPSLNTLVNIKELYVSNGIKISDIDLPALFHLAVKGDYRTELTVDDLARLSKRSPAFMSFSDFRTVDGELVSAKDQSKTITREQLCDAIKYDELPEGFNDIYVKENPPLFNFHLS